MASVKTISLPHGTIPTQMFGNVNLQNAMMYVNENFAAAKDGVNDAISAMNDALKDKAEADHDHDDAYAALEHSHGMDAVTGLNAALDGKAELNHEHSQYLSSLPAHYHDVSGIQGLGERLQAKAESVHSHTIAQVESLSTELGVKASTSYVDQQIGSVGSSIKTIADQEIESYGASKSGEEGAASADIPKNVKIAPSDETVEQKNARVGTSARYARSDHEHVFETETSDLTKLKCDGSGDEGTADFGTETKVPRIDHSHPLNYPPSEARPSGLTPDGTGDDDEKNNAGRFGNTTYYADLGHSHALNVDPSTTFLPSDVVKSGGSSSAGSSKYYAQADHVHRMPALAESDIADLETDLSAIEGEVDNHETRISALEGGSGGGTVKSVDGQQPDANGNVSLASDATLVQRSMVGQSNGVQGYSAVLNAVATGGHYDTEDGAHDITSPVHYVSTVSENAMILGVAANSSSVSLRSAIGADMVSYDGENTLDSVVGSDGIIDGTSHVAVGSDSGSWVKTSAGGLLVASDETPVTIETPPLNPSIASVDSDGVITAEAEIPTAAQTSDKVLTVKKGGTALSWENAISNETGTTSTLGSFPTDEMTQTGGVLWTSGGDNGVCLLALFDCTEHSPSSAHTIGVCKLTISKDGLVTKIERVRNCGIDIMA